MELISRLIAILICLGTTAVSAQEVDLKVIRDRAQTHLESLGIDVRQVQEHGIWIQEALVFTGKAKKIKGSQKPLYRDSSALYFLVETDLGELAVKMPCYFEGTKVSPAELSEKSFSLLTNLVGVKVKPKANSAAVAKLINKLATDYDATVSELLKGRLFTLKFSTALDAIAGRKLLEDSKFFEYVEVTPIRYLDSTSLGKTKSLGAGKRAQVVDLAPLRVLRKEIEARGGVFNEEFGKACQ